MSPNLYRLGLFCRFDEAQGKIFFIVILLNAHVCSLLPNPNQYNCNIAPVLPQALQESPLERKRDMKTIMKDLLIIATMMVGLIGVAAFCLFAPPIPLWVSLPIVAIWTAWIFKGVLWQR